MEDIHEYLGKCLGSTKIPLSYIVRPDNKRRVVALADDPPDNYITPELEMVSRAPHYQTPVANPPVVTDTFREDNLLVMTILHSIFCDHKSYPYIKRANRTGDGRAGYFSLHSHYLGPNSVDSQAAAAEKTLLDAA